MRKHVHQIGQNKHYTPSILQPNEQLKRIPWGPSIHPEHNSSSSSSSHALKSQHGGNIFKPVPKGSWPEDVDEGAPASTTVINLTTANIVAFYPRITRKENNLNWWQTIFHPLQSWLVTQSQWLCAPSWVNTILWTFNVTKGKCASYGTRGSLIGHAAQNLEFCMKNKISSTGN